MERLACDVVVLGGGTGACVVAGRLAAESDADVVVLEAGPDYGPRDSGRWPRDLLDAGALVASHYDTGDFERANELATTEPLRSLIAEEVAPGREADLEEAIRRSHVHYYHPVGTCALGPADDPLAVCDVGGRLHGLEQFLVADCSLMPVVPRANTNVPAVVVAERVADEVLAQR